MRKARYFSDGFARATIINPVAFSFLRLLK